MGGCDGRLVSGHVSLLVLEPRKAYHILFLPAHRFIDVGGYKLLNSWLTYSKTTNNIPLLQQILLTLQHLPLTVDHLKQVSLGFTPTFPLWANLDEGKLASGLMGGSSLGFEVEEQRKMGISKWETGFVSVIRHMV